MVFNIIILALVAGITFMHSTFGFYGGLINLFCVLFGMVVAFGAYEYVTDMVTGATYMHAAYVGPCTLMLLFFLTTLILRSLADSLIRGNVPAPQWLDTSGAAFCGFVNAQVTVGILAISILMLPLGGNVLGFERMTRTEERDPDHDILPAIERHSLWLRSDEMAVALFNWISGGSMRGGTAFASVYPDFTEAVFYSGNTVQVESSPAATRDKNGDGFKGIKLAGPIWEQTGRLEDVKYRREVPSQKQNHPRYERLASGFAPATGNKLLGARIELKKAAGDRVNNAGRHVFRPTMIRLVGDTNGRPAQYVPRALANADDKIGTDIRVVDFDNNFSLRDQDATIDAYFEVPEDFAPRFLEYRRYARTKAELAAEGEGAPSGDLVAQKTADQLRQEQASGRRTFGNVASGSAEQALLPLGNTGSRQALAQAGVQLEGNLVVGGSFAGPVARFRGNQGGAVERMKVPDGKTMVQIIYTPKQAQTLAGQVFNYVGQLNQYRVVDDRGNTHPMVGYYGKVTRRGEEYVEFFYNGDASDPVVNPGYASMLDFKDLEQSEINDADNATLGLFFLVPKGVRIVRVENQTGDGGDINISTGP